ncbi:TIGR03085 family protein [Streptosporangium violaceochromogenes]|nr:TIGR03085 family protein [Streptosporangium violaceochromogenes]
MTHARAGRAALGDLLAEAGQTAPTLCEGWTSFDLAAHLVLRESRLDAAGGIALKPLAGYTISVQEALKVRHGYAGLIEIFRAGPHGPYRLIPGLDEIVNTVEFFVHHEDVRRARPGWSPRALPADLDETLWRWLRAGSRVLLRRSPVGVVLRRAGNGVALGGPSGGPRVEVAGPAAELLLFCFGRQRHAAVDVTGRDTAVARLMDAPLGV